MSKRFSIWKNKICKIYREIQDIFIKMQISTESNKLLLFSFIDENISKCNRSISYHTILQKNCITSNVYSHVCKNNIEFTNVIKEEK